MALYYSTRGETEKLGLLEGLKLKVSRVRSKWRLISQEKQAAFWPDTPESHQTVISRVWPYTRTSIERLQMLCRIIDYVNEKKVEGDFVECGVWKGGNIGVFSLFGGGELKRDVYAYDTYAGMSAPCEQDGKYANDRFKALALSDASSNWCDASLEEVKRCMAEMLDGQPSKVTVHYIVGMVEKTLKKEDQLPNQISVLRLDTDFYESTKVELEILYPRLVKGGVLILDDYGHWKGARRAFDEYFKDKDLPLISACDYTCRFFVKP